jgi:hypothetical protein
VFSALKKEKTMITHEGIRATGMYLLKILKSQSQVDYSHFYKDDKTAETLSACAIEFVDDTDSDDAADDLYEDGHVMLEYAAQQLEDIGVVRITELPTVKLPDGEFDFQIALTASGARKLADNSLTYNFRHPNHWICAAPASIWLIELLNGGDPGCQVSLRDVMETADSELQMSVSDYFGNEYGIGTGSYIWAFEVSLWHHAKTHHIKPVLKSEQHRLLWIEMIRPKTGRPNLSLPFFDNPLWDVPFTLRPGVSTLTMSHVGDVSDM